MKFTHSLFFLICCALAVVGCEGDPIEKTDADQTADASGGPADADNLPDTNADEDSETSDLDVESSDEVDTDPADDTQNDEGGPGQTGDTSIDVHGNDSVSCDGTPEAVRAGVVGRAIQCQLDHHDGLTTASLKIGDVEENVEEDEATQPDTGELGEPILFVFDPSGWDLAGLEEELIQAGANSEALVVPHDLLRDFIYHQGLAPGVNDLDGVVRALSDSFADAIVGETHSCVSTYLRDYEVMFDCLGEPTPTLPCGEASSPHGNSDESCSSHNGTVADWVEAYLMSLGLLTGGADVPTVFESIVTQEDFSFSVLGQKLTMADLRFYRYYYAKRDWTLPNSESVQASFLNPNNWARYPLIEQSVEEACGSEDIPRCCEYQAFINAYDSNPLELLASVNSCTNEFASFGPYENSQLYKVLLQHDGSVGNDGAFTIDEFFRPFILHYEKTTAPEHRGVCYWTALREFAAQTITVDAGNAAGEMTAQDMDAYIQSYNQTLAEFDGLEPTEPPAGICEAPVD